MRQIESVVAAALAGIVVYGAAAQDAVQWRWNAHVFASWGYIVTWHNFHGSSGFGQAFTDSINPDRISKHYEDTIKAAEWLIGDQQIG